jgi:hypothetical protein
MYTKNMSGPWRDVGENGIFSAIGKVRRRTREPRS